MHITKNHGLGKIRKELLTTQEPVYRQMCVCVFSCVCVLGGGEDAQMSGSGQCLFLAQHLDTEWEGMLKFFIPILIYRKIVEGVQELEDYICQYFIINLKTL
ncbi:hypothetical protein ACJX0J_016420 [Zea mays]